MVTVRTSHKAVARQLIKNHIEMPGHTLEELYSEIAFELKRAAESGHTQGFNAAEGMVVDVCDTCDQR